jgi:hypothetical protein
MATAKPAYFWKADVELKINNLAFSLQSRDEGMGSNKKRIFGADWLRDGKVYFNPAQRVKGWFQKNLPLVRSSYQAQVAAIKVFPSDGNGIWVAIAEAKDLQGTNQQPEDNCEYPKGLSYPFKQHITVSDAKGGTRSTTTYWLTLPAPVNIKVKIMSFARSLEPAMIEEALKEIGVASGLGDKHSQSYGTFELVSFKAEQKRLKL